MSIEIEKIPRPGSVKDCPYPFQDMKEYDEDSFSIPAASLKESAKIRTAVFSSMNKQKKAGNLPDDFSIESKTEKTDGEVTSIRFWVIEPKVKN